MTDTLDDQFIRGIVDALLKECGNAPICRAGPVVLLFESNKTPTARDISNEAFQLKNRRSETLEELARDRASRQVHTTTPRAIAHALVNVRVMVRTYSPQSLYIEISPKSPTELLLGVE